MGIFLRFPKDDERVNQTHSKLIVLVRFQRGEAVEILQVIIILFLHQAKCVHFWGTFF